MNREIRQKTLVLPTPLDLSRESLIFASKALSDWNKDVSSPTLYCVESAVSREIAEWLWQEHRGWSVNYIPPELLASAHAWALSAHWSAATSVTPPEALGFIPIDVFTIVSIPPL